MIGRRATMLKLESAYAHYTSGTLQAVPGGVNLGIAEVFLHNELSGGTNGWVQPWQRRRFGDVPAYFELPQIEARNPHRFAQCFFKRVVRALRLSQRELLRLDALFELRARAHHANGTRRDGQAGGGMRYRCHPWVELFGRNSSSDCTRHDNNRWNNRVMPGLSGYEDAHPEHLFVVGIA
jgi:hypothetical protein